jgi:hypothetical protein
MEEVGIGKLDEVATAVPLAPADELPAVSSDPVVVGNAQ